MQHGHGDVRANPTSVDGLRLRVSDDGDSFSEQLLDVAVRQPEARYQRTARTITSGGKRKPAKADRVARAGEGGGFPWRQSRCSDAVTARCNKCRAMCLVVALELDDGPGLLPAVGVGGRRGGKPDTTDGRDSPRGSYVSAAQSLGGRDRIRTCVGNAGDFTGRTAVTSRVPSHPDPVPIIGRDVHKRPVDSFRPPSASPPVPAGLAQPRLGRRESGGKAPPTPGFEFRTDVVSRCNARRSVVDRAACPTTRLGISRAGRRGGVGVVGRGGPHGAPRLAVNSPADRSSHSSQIGCAASSSCSPARAGSWWGTARRRC
jgi:hypothetical protein